eukprot:CAMPEP_0174257728 /NCGR_PEP_ID=MMETSP0439-20130205/6849_1 /TAXON_ID=0 /ORGANISM="Stereomyxa ramosa, Strain Chinc5" /LENGTH=873 /DNA_ID=CAMNT_0015340961 /DNA_START=236 /DNA_END=2857 /DNA_ORIENTATION=-
MDPYAAKTGDNTAGSNSTELSTEVLPTNYIVALQPFGFDNNTEGAEPYFEGQLELHMKVATQQSSLLLNAENIRIKEAIIQIPIGTIFGLVELQKVDYTDDFVKFKFKEDIPAGEDIVLLCNYTGKITNDMRGFYRSRIVDEEGNVKWIAATQFESIGARRAFPSFDRPSFKATFEITMTAPKQYSVLSNMPPIHSETTGDLQVVQFAKTPKMSTYLVAFVIGDLEFVEHAADDSLPVIRVYGTKGTGISTDDLKFSLYEAVSSLQFYNNYFGIKYDLPKLDLIGIPDFAAGAMENWGLVTFRLSDLIISDESSLGNKKRVSEVVAHEIAHQWTGNLVTIEWWSDLWLNEGCATFFSALCVAEMHPDWKFMESFLSTQSSALQADARETTHALENKDCKTNADVDAMFDAITYSKGGSILHMLETHDSAGFKEMMHTYLSRYNYSNVMTDDFWKVFKEQYPIIDDSIQRWTDSPGFPLVSVDKKGSTWSVKQQRYGNSFTDDPTIWWINLQFVDTDFNLNKLEFSEKETSFTNGGEWIKLNAQQNGFYRVNYTEELWDSLGASMRDQHAKWNVVDRAGLVGDALALASSNQLHPRQALKLLQVLSVEEDSLVWGASLSGLGSFASRMRNEECYGSYERYMQTILEPISKKVGWEEKANETSSEKELRNQILYHSLIYNVADVTEHAKQLFDDFISDPEGNAINPDLRSTVYRAGIEYGGDKEWNALFKRYNTTSDPSERNRLLLSFGRTRLHYLLLKTLNMALDTDVVRLQDTSYVIAPVAANPLGQDVVWNWFKANWNTLKDYPQILRIIEIVTRHFSTKYHYQDVESFFNMSEHQVEGYEPVVKRVLQTITVQQRWLDAYAKDLCAWLDNN